MACVHRQIGEPLAMDWEAVLPKTYEADDVSGVEAKVIIGPQDGHPNYYVRYFRVELEARLRLTNMNMTMASSSSTAGLRLCWGRRRSSWIHRTSSTCLVWRSTNSAPWGPSRWAFCA